MNVTVGPSLLLYAVAAPFIGGVSLKGGRGRVSGMLGGAMILFAIAVDALRVRRTGAATHVA